VYLPVLFVLTGLLAVVDRSTKSERRIRAREVIVAAAVLATMVAGYAAPHRSSGELRWKPMLAKARIACAANKTIRPIQVSGRSFHRGALIPIDPVHWVIWIGCSRLH
jgi:hypothetical protein